MDCTSGLHLRLRLHGDAWPPQLMYRVYVHSVVADMTATTLGLPAPEYAGKLIFSGLAISGCCLCNCCRSQPVLEAKPAISLAAVTGSNSWRAVRMDTPMSSVLQQWRAAQARARTKPHVTYPPLVPAQQQAVRAREARQQRMLRMYRQHCTGDPEMDEDMTHDDILQWCSDLNMADYFE